MNIIYFYYCCYNFYMLYNVNGVCVCFFFFFFSSLLSTSCLLPIFFLSSLRRSPSNENHDAGKKYVLLQIAFLDANSVLNVIVPCQVWSLIYATPTKMAETAARPFCHLSYEQNEVFEKKVLHFFEDFPLVKRSSSDAEMNELLVANCNTLTNMKKNVFPDILCLSSMLLASVLKRV